MYRVALMYMVLILNAIRNTGTSRASRFLWVCLATVQLYSHFSLFIERLTSFFLSLSDCSARALPWLLSCYFVLLILCLFYPLCTTWSASFIPFTWFLFPESMDCSDSTGDHFALKLCTVLKHRVTFHFSKNQAIFSLENYHLMNVADILSYFPSFDLYF